MGVDDNERLRLERNWYQRECNVSVSWVSHSCGHVSEWWLLPPADLGDESHKDRFTFPKYDHRAICEVIIFFECSSFFRNILQKKPLSVYQDYRQGMLVCFCMQALVTVWEGHFRKRPFTKVCKATSFYILSDINIYQIQVIAKHFEGLSVLLQQKSPVDIGSLLQRKEDVDTAFFDCMARTGDAHCYVKCFIFDSMNSLFLGYGLHPDDKQ